MNFGVDPKHLNFDVSSKGIILVDGVLNHKFSDLLLFF